MESLPGATGSQRACEYLSLPTLNELIAQTKIIFKKTFVFIFFFQAGAKSKEFS